jgi:hypothetical protein
LANNFRENPKKTEKIRRNPKQNPRNPKKSQESEEIRALAAVTGPEANPKVPTEAKPKQNRRNPKKSEGHFQTKKRAFGFASEKATFGLSFAQTPPISQPFQITTNTIA